MILSIELIIKYLPVNVTNEIFWGFIVQSLFKTNFFYIKNYNFNNYFAVLALLLLHNPAEVF